MEEMLARVAALEQKIATDHCKKVFEISCNVALQRLITCEKEIKWRLERVIDLASRRCNDTITRNGVVSKMQRDEVKDLVSKLETRVDSQTKGVANMEAGLKQLQDLESKLIQIIRQDQNDTTARLEELEKSSTILAAVTADIEACLEAKASEIMNKVTTDIEASLEAKVSAIRDELSTGMRACLGTTKSKEMFGEAQKGNNGNNGGNDDGDDDGDDNSDDNEDDDGDGDDDHNADETPGDNDNDGDDDGGDGDDEDNADVRGPSPLVLRSSSLRCPRGSRSRSSSRRTNAEHGASVTAEDDASSCSQYRRLQSRSRATSTGDTNHAHQMALGQAILRRSRDEMIPPHRGRASSVREMIHAAQGEAYSRVVAARRPASLQPDQLLPLSMRNPRRWWPIIRDVP
jgi:hypothetical protein